MCTCQDLQLLRGQRYSRWRPAAILNYSFIHKIDRFHRRKEKLSTVLPGKCPARISPRQNLQLGAKIKIFKMASSRHFQLLFF